MICTICNKKEATESFHGLMICKDCKKTEEKACIADNRYAKELGL